MKFTFYDKSAHEKVITMWGPDKHLLTEVVNMKKNGRWMWECRACRASDCDHVMQAKSWLRQRRAEQEEIWRRMDALYPAPTARPHIKFAPCPD